MKKSSRHPALVTAERLDDAAKKWAYLLTGQERDALTLVRDALTRIAARATGSNGSADQ